MLIKKRKVQNSGARKNQVLQKLYEKLITYTNMVKNVLLMKHKLIREFHKSYSFVSTKK